tara:strand:+ start:995 stop:1243 length:249 start_codon:yes stop_codon:yes gene_type:complete
MNSNEFVFWLKGIVDSTDFMPTKKTWDLIVDVVGTVKLNKKEPTPLNDAVVNRLTELRPPPPSKNPYDVTCDTNSTKNNTIK